jgi:hypothetical protein
VALIGVELRSAKVGVRNARAMAKLSLSRGMPRKGFTVKRSIVLALLPAALALSAILPQLLVSGADLATDASSKSDLNQKRYDRYMAEEVKDLADLPSHFRQQSWKYGTRVLQKT